MNYGDLGKRFVASLIDGFAVMVIGALFGFIMALLMLWWVALIIAPFISIIYYTVMEGSGWHATLGKRAMGIYVVDENGIGVTYSKSILRSLGKILSGLVLGIGYLMCLFNDEKQCLHDIIAKTYVVTGKAAGSEGSESARLIAVAGPLAGMVYTVPNSGLLIGRDSKSCQVVIPASQQNVSRVHCLVTFNPMSEMFVLSDRNSKLGTFLGNGNRVVSSKPVAIRRGSRFYLATRENTFEVR